jgi:hypothetical protein
VDGRSLDAGRAQCQQRSNVIVDTSWGFHSGLVIDEVGFGHDCGSFTGFGSSVKVMLVLQWSYIRGLCIDVLIAETSQPVCVRASKRWLSAVHAARCLCVSASACWWYPVYPPRLQLWMDKVCSGGGSKATMAVALRVRAHAAALSKGMAWSAHVLVASRPSNTSFKPWRRLV